MGTNGTTRGVDNLGNNSLPTGATGGNGTDAKNVPVWQEKLMRRLQELRPGRRYAITLTVGVHGEYDWTIDEGQKVQRP